MTKPEIVEHPDSYTNESWHGSSATTIRQVVFGMNDGLVATVGLVAGLTFARSSTHVVIIATLSAIIAAVVSMALGSYLSTQTEVHYQQAQIRREEYEIEHTPHKELDEMREIYEGYGFNQEETQMILARLSQNKKLWLNLMLRDELGIIPEEFESPWKNALEMAVAVLAGSIPPLLPEFFTSTPKSVFSLVLFLSAATAFILGAITGRTSGRIWWKSGFSFLFVAAIAAIIGMGAGSIISPLFG